MPFVIPEIDPLLMEPPDFRIDHARIGVRMAHENIGFIAFVGSERLIQRTLPARQFESTASP